MSRRRILGFVDAPTGEWRELRDPDASATARQLLRLNALGLLEVVEPGSPLTKAEAAAALELAAAAGLYAPRRLPGPRERFDRTCRKVVEHVRTNPGCTTMSVEQAVGGNRDYLRDRIRDLLELGALQDRARSARRRELYVDDRSDEGDH